VASLCALQRRQAAIVVGVRRLQAVHNVNGGSSSKMVSIEASLCALQRGQADVVVGVRRLQAVHNVNGGSGSRMVSIEASLCALQRGQADVVVGVRRVQAVHNINGGGSSSSRIYLYSQRRHTPATNTNNQLQVITPETGMKVTDTAVQTTTSPAPRLCVLR
jgi:hypothetical protein